MCLRSFFSDILKIYFEIEDEPLPPDAIQEVIENQQVHQNYLKRLRNW